MQRTGRFVAAVMSAVLLASVTPALGASNAIMSVSFSDAGHGIMVGGTAATNGFISVTSDGGAHWRAMPQSRKMFEVSAVTSQVALATNQATEDMMRTTDGGLNWVTSGGLGAGVKISDVEQLESGRIVAVGWKDPDVTFGRLAGIWISDDQGSTWSRVLRDPRRYDPADPAVPVATDATLNDVDVAPGSSVSWAVGTERADGKARTALVYKSVDGSTWVTQTVPPVPPLTVYAVNCVAAASDQVAYVGGATAVRKTVDGGATWALTSLPMRPDATSNQLLDLRAMAAVNTTTVVIVGTGQNTLTSKPYVGFTKNGGASWTVKQLGTAPLNSVAVIDSDSWLVVGEQENVLRTDDAGVTWKVVSGAAAAPEVSIVAPVGGAALEPGAFPVEGTASDKGVGVASVAVAITRADGKYYSGGVWQSAAAWHDATSDDGFQTWSFPFVADPADGQYTIQAKAVDGLGLSKTVSVQSGDTRVASSLSMTSKSATLAYKGTAYVKGALSIGGVLTAGRTVVLQKASSAAGPYSDVSSMVTGSGGAYSFSVRPSSYTRYRVRFASSLAEQASVSASVGFDPKVYLSAKPWATYGSSTVTTFYRTRTYTWRSTLAPRHTKGSYAGRVYFERYSASKGKYVAYTSRAMYAYDYGSISRIKASYKFPYKGKWRVRVYHNDAGHAPTYSSWKYVYVR